MLDVCLLGTGGMMPLPNRHLTSLLCRLQGSSLLIDCGEGTQVALRKADFSAPPIDVILLTHFHGDHISGLPGLLLTMGNGGRTEPLLIVGPKGVEKTVNMLRVAAPELPFSICFRELTETTEDFAVNDYQIRAFRVSHKITCYGYTITVNRLPKFSAEKAKEQEIPLCFWNRLQHGETVSDNGRVYTPELVMGPPRKGLKLTYVTDTLPVEKIVENAKESDLFICEGMYGDPEKKDHLLECKHMLMQEAAELARSADVKELWLTHYSPAEIYPKAYQEELGKIFKNTVISKDGRMTTLRFPDEEE